ncbi:MAG: CocE/NonD family hydrolase [Leadbetterella sp.]|nr:CocE/NonD family hydrolase [Leadbetterella sp.]
MALRILIGLLLISNISFGQNYPFQVSDTSDSLSIQKEIATLAKNILQDLPNPTSEKELNLVFRLQIAAREYEMAEKTFLEFIEWIAKEEKTPSNGIGFQFNTFLKTLNEKSDKAFAEHYLEVFKKEYAKLNNAEKIEAESYFSTDIAQIKKGFFEVLKSGSVSKEEGILLCRSYASYVVYSQVLKPVASFLAEVENQKYDIQDSLLIKTRDGALIHATIARKKNALEKLPTVMIFNIYSGSGDKADAKLAAEKGYVGVVVNTRGKSLSPQDIEPFEHDAKDAYDAIDWISKQAWSDGKVGMYGGSYLGFSQWAAAKTLHPALKTIVPQVSVGVGVDYPLANNIFMTYMLRWIHFVGNNKGVDMTEMNNEAYWHALAKKWYVSGKSFRALDSLDGRPNAIFQRWVDHPKFDSYWKNMTPNDQEFSRLNIPVLTISGYYDEDQRGAMYYYNKHLKLNKSANHYLLLGPYDHFGAQASPSTKLGGYAIDSVAKLNITNLVFEWFDFVFKNKPRPEILKDKVNIEVMGKNAWRHLPQLSKMNNDTLTFYLSNTRKQNHYKLDMKTGGASEYIKHEIDFADRSDSSKLKLLGEAIVIDSVFRNDNSLRFVSEPFSKAFDINGEFLGQLKASINKKDMDIRVDLYEMLPDGRLHWLSNSLQRASFIENREKRQLLTPNKKETLSIKDSFFTSKTIDAGSRLAVVLSINKNLDWEINYGTGKEVSSETIKDAKVPLQIKWYADSFIKIPVFKY